MGSNQSSYRGHTRALVAPSPCGKSPETRQKVPHLSDEGRASPAGEVNLRRAPPVALLRAQLMLEGRKALTKWGSLGLGPTFMLVILRLFIIGDNSFCTPVARVIIMINKS